MNHRRTSRTVSERLPSISYNDIYTIEHVRLTIKLKLKPEIYYVAKGLSGFIVVQLCGKTEKTALNSERESTRKPLQ
jgi:hypothetical protein